MTDNPVRENTSELSGYATAALTCLIAASYPVATRSGVTGPFTPSDLILLRFGIGALIFLPYLIWHLSAIRGKLWLQGLWLTIFQGAGMAGLVIGGLQFAPASHAAALGPGASPAWVAALGFFFFYKTPCPQAVVGAALCLIGVVVLTCCSGWSMGAATLVGDVMFLAASALGAAYVLQLRNWGIGALLSAAIVTLYSAAIIVPWHLATGSQTLWHASAGEIVWQVIWQGVLVGCVALVALNHAVARLGAERSTAVMALVPVMTSFLALLFLGEIPSPLETIAILMITVGVTVGARRSANKRQILWGPPKRYVRLT